MKTAISLFATGMALCTMLRCLPAAAQTKSALDAGVQDTVKQFNLVDSRHQDLEDRAAGMLVFPQVTKGGIGLDAHPENPRRLRRRKKSHAAESKPRRRRPNGSQCLLDLGYERIRFIADKLQCHM